ncbi:putative 2-aminoethylphosphonate ABC transporter permease subunit [Pseudomonas abietaniphila]|uniref:Iron(III) transport system permease protein n=1 Tax=Pseudomonas abietaniphila TaxID=89065 RepID=A0A1G8GB95_9PSED|nr:putative 2-aminoethylphosphonate ABC transporter permease subunit [Pseudomonas abietaniphila]SDH91644.1 iron(III) transport system permease protein [Pseudomonas abietaniphila]
MTSLRLPQSRELPPQPKTNSSAAKLDLLFSGGLKLVMVMVLVVGLALPLIAMLSKVADVQNGIAGVWQMLSSSRFLWLLGNSIKVSLSTVALVVPAAYLFAYALQRSWIPGKALLRSISLLPLMAPSMLSAIALIYLFGNQGLLKSWFPDGIYGYSGIVLGQAFYNFPMALMILISALGLADARLYDASLSMGATHWKTFLNVTWPSTRYAVFAASCLVFTQTITNFGIPVVIGGDYQVLAMEAYKSVVGQQKFSEGALIGSILLVPALISFAVDVWMRRLRGGQVSSQAAAYVAPDNGLRDSVLLVAAGIVALALLSLVVVAVGASLINFWPYDLSVSLRHYDFETNGDVGWLAYRNSLMLASLTALIGTPVIFTCAYLMEKTRSGWLDNLLRLLCMLPMAVPGLVMGLGYVFFFNHPDNPLNGMYGGIALMVVCCVMRFLTPAQMTATTALRQLNEEIEYASLSLKVPLITTYRRVTLPICLPALLEVFRYLFVSSMTSVSALIFLYSPDTVLAAVAVLNLDDAGNIGAAAALSSLILLTSALVSLALYLLSRGLLRHTQHWRTGHA